MSLPRLFRVIKQNFYQLQPQNCKASMYGIPSLSNTKAPLPYFIVLYTHLEKVNKVKSRKKRPENYNVYARSSLYYKGERKKEENCANRRCAVCTPGLSRDAIEHGRKAMVYCYKLLLNFSLLLQCERKREREAKVCIKGRKKKIMKSVKKDKR